MNSYFSGQQPPTSDYPQVIDMTLTSGLAPAHLDVVGGSPELADDARVRLFELERLWLDDDAEDGLACLRAPSRSTRAVSPETLLLLALAETLRGDPGGPLTKGPAPRLLDLRDVADGPDIPRTPKGSADVPPRLDFTTMTVSIDDPVSDAVLSSLRSWSSSLTVDLVMADLIEGGAWGACVAVGGVARSYGITPDGGEWTVTMLAPDGLTRVIRLGDGAIASSTRAAVHGDRAPHSSLRDAREDRIIWAAVGADMAWEGQVMADRLVGLTEEAAVRRLSGTAGTALLYRRDGHLHDYPTHGSAAVTGWRTTDPRGRSRPLHVRQRDGP